MVNLRRADPMTGASSSSRPAALLLDSRDTAAVALVPLHPGTTVDVQRGDEALRVVAAGLIPFGHKIAVVPMAAGDPVVKYGEVIGFATAAIRPGDHVHVHNVRSDRAKLDDG
jgi:altronate dehydratase small subunit